MSADRQITQILNELGSGDREAAAQLLPLVYDELRALAEVHFQRENPGHTLQPTVLVHDAYLRLVQRPAITIKNRAHFFRLASKLMRQLLVDHARKKLGRKRSVDRRRLTLPGVDAEADEEIDAVDLEEALQRLHEISQRRVELIELRFYGGLSMDEAAQTLGVSLETGKREWRLARAWLARELSRGAS